MKLSSVQLPRISIITPSYNQAQYIAETIESVKNQDYPDLEHIIIDGGSTDGTLEILSQYDGQIRWISEPDTGQVNAINKGLRSATGEVIAFLNSDDLYLPDALLKVGQYFSDHPEASWVTGRCQTVDGNFKITRRQITAYKNFWLYFRSNKVLLTMNYLSQPATFWRRSAMERVGLLDESLHYTMDYDYWLRLSECYRLHVIHEDLAIFRLHAQSKSGTTAHRQFDEQYKVLVRNHPPAIYLALHRIHNWITVVAYSKQIQNIVDIAPVNQ
jgi:glycosyltransferase involved in cell wall biosynthesis